MLKYLVNLTVLLSFSSLFAQDNSFCQELKSVEALVDKAHYSPKPEAQK